MWYHMPYHKRYDLWYRGTTCSIGMRYGVRYHMRYHMPYDMP